jgi:hypothetical protein
VAFDCEFSGLTVAQDVRPFPHRTLDDALDGARAGIEQGFQILSLGLCPVIWDPEKSRGGLCSFAKFQNSIKESHITSTLT